MNTSTIQKTLATILTQLHRYGATLVVNGADLELVAAGPVTIPDGLKSAIRSIKSATIELLCDWPTMTDPNCCPVCCCPSFRMGDAGTLLCRSCQPMRRADKSPIIHVVCDDAGTPYWEPLPARALSPKILNRRTMTHCSKEPP